MKWLPGVKMQCFQGGGINNCCNFTSTNCYWPRWAVRQGSPYWSLIYHGETGRQSVSCTWIIHSLKYFKTARTSSQWSKPVHFLTAIHIDTHFIFAAFTKNYNFQRTLLNLSQLLQHHEFLIISSQLWHTLHGEIHFHSMKGALFLWSGKLLKVFKQWFAVRKHWQWLQHNWANMRICKNINMTKNVYFTLPSLTISNSLLIRWNNEYKIQ